MKRAHVRYGLLIAGTIALVGCGGGVQFTASDTTVYTPRAKDAPVEITDGGTMKPHTVIGTLVVKEAVDASFDGTSTYDKALEKMKQKARKVGADALIRVKHEMGDEGANPKIHLTATAVRYMTPGGTIGSEEDSGR